MVSVPHRTVSAHALPVLISRMPLPCVNSSFDGRTMASPQASVSTVSRTVTSVFPHRIIARRIFF